MHNRLMYDDTKNVNVDTHNFYILDFLTHLEAFKTGDPTKISYQISFYKDNQHPRVIDLHLLEKILSRNIYIQSLHFISFPKHDFLQASLIRSLSKLPSLRKIGFTTCNINPEVLTCLFAANKNITSLCIEKDNLNNSHAVMLAHQLNNCTALQRLWLVNNNIGNQGVVELTKTLIHLPNLSIVGLSANNYTKEGIACLVNLVKSHPNLKELIISTKGVPSTHIFESNDRWAKALKDNKSLEVLVLSHVSEKNFIDIVEAMKHNFYLQQITFLSSPEIYTSQLNDTMKKLKNSLERNKIIYKNYFDLEKNLDWLANNNHMKEDNHRTYVSTVNLVFKNFMLIFHYTGYYINQTKIEKQFDDFVNTVLLKTYSNFGNCHSTILHVFFLVFTAKEISQLANKARLIFIKMLLELNTDKKQFANKDKIVLGLTFLVKNTSLADTQLRDAFLSFSSAIIEKSEPAAKKQCIDLLAYYKNYIEKLSQDDIQNLFEKLERFLNCKKSCVIKQATALQQIESSGANSAVHTDNHLIEKNNNLISLTLPTLVSIPQRTALFNKNKIEMVTNVEKETVEQRCVKRKR